MGGPFEVRSVDPNSAPAVAALFRDAYRRYYDQTFLDESRLVRYLAAPENTCWIALARGRVVGFASVSVEDGRRARLSHLVRHPTLGRGAGSALEEVRQGQLTDWVGDGSILLAYAHCLCSSPASEALKLRYGFQPVAVKLGHLPDVSGCGQRDTYVVVVKRWHSDMDGTSKRPVIPSEQEHEFRFVQESLAFAGASTTGPGEDTGASFSVHQRVDEDSGRADVMIDAGCGDSAGLPMDAVLDRLFELRSRLESLVCYIDVGQSLACHRLVELLERDRFFAIGFFPCPPDSAAGMPGRVYLLLQHLSPAVRLDRSKIGLASDSSKRIFESIWARYRDRAQLGAIQRGSPEGAGTFGGNP